MPPPRARVAALGADQRVAGRQRAAALAALADGFTRTLGKTIVSVVGIVSKEGIDGLGARGAGDR